MPDRSIDLILAGLSRAHAEAEGLPLIDRKSAPGLFPSTPSGRKAAKLSRDLGYVSPVGTRKQGRHVDEICTLTEKGATYLIDQVSPKHALIEVAEVLKEREKQVAELEALTGKLSRSLEALAARVHKALDQLKHSNGRAHPSHPAAGSLAHAQPKSTLGIAEILKQWHESGALNDCPLPELFAQVRKDHPDVTVGQLHDELRRLHENEEIYIYPWTGPRHALPEPRYALLMGHDIGYYAGLRNAPEEKRRATDKHG